MQRSGMVAMVVTVPSPASSRTNENFGLFSFPPQKPKFSIVRLKAGLDPVLSFHPPFRFAAWRATSTRPADGRDFFDNV
ncbi:MAG TPA: hypothetical protein VFU50_03955 [Terriglobales bacterium]|nr:hypothetical protein [Terriglobales bacterium]